MCVRIFNRNQDYSKLAEEIAAFGSKGAAFYFSFYFTLIYAIIIKTKGDIPQTMKTFSDFGYPIEIL